MFFDLYQLIFPPCSQKRPLTERVSKKSFLDRNNFELEPYESWGHAALLALEENRLSHFLCYRETLVSDILK